MLKLTVIFGFRVCMCVSAAEMCVYYDEVMRVVHHERGSNWKDWKRERGEEKKEDNSMVACHKLKPGLGNQYDTDGHRSTHWSIISPRLLLSPSFHYGEELPLVLFSSTTSTFTSLSRFHGPLSWRMK